MSAASEPMGSILGPRSPPISAEKASIRAGRSMRDRSPIASAMMPAVGWLFITAEEPAAMTPVTRVPMYWPSSAARRMSVPIASVSPAVRRPLATRKIPITKMIASHPTPLTTATSEPRAKIRYATANAVAPMAAT